MNNENLTSDQIKGIFQALDHLLEADVWHSSVFLVAIEKKIRKIYTDFSELVTPPEVPSALELQEKARHLQRQHLQEVYISLYSSEGSSLQAWERLLSNLSRYVVSRPIYAHEDHVISLIKSKTNNKVNEAYVAIYIEPSDNLKVMPDKMVVDKFGKTLLSLKDKAIKLENISKFVHNFVEYAYVKGHLVKK